ncbi:MAG: hypothetical protein ACYDAZ_06315 [Thermoplasmataceae archaeon]
MKRVRRNNIKGKKIQDITTFLLDKYGYTLSYYYLSPRARIIHKIAVRQYSCLLNFTE